MPVGDVIKRTSPAPSARNITLKHRQPQDEPDLGLQEGGGDGGLSCLPYPYIGYPLLGLV